MKQQPRAVGRFKKLEVAYICVCLCLDTVARASTTVTNAQLKKGQPPTQLRDAGNRKNLSNPNNQIEEGSLSNVLTRKSRALPQLGIFSLSADEENALQTIKRAPSDSKPAYIIPNLRPGRSEQALEQDMDSAGALDKRSKGTLIPFPRLGRSRAFDANEIMPYPDSWIIPYLPKIQREPVEIDESIFDDIPVNDEYSSKNLVDVSEGVDRESNFESENTVSSEDIADSLQAFEMHSDSESPESIKERQTDDNGTVIPYPRLGKRDNSSLKNARVNDNFAARKARTSDSLIPQIRYGRSALTEKSPKPQKQPFYILPNYRPGRSSSDSAKILKFDTISKQGILPYPRPGRSEVGINKRQDYMLPVARFGRSTDESINLEKVFLPLSSFMKDQLPTELQTELLKSGEFLIPYPRPGKRFFGTKPLPPNVKLEIKDKDQSLFPEIKEKESNSVTFVLPYPRPGRSNNEKRGNHYVIPSARFGRSVPNSMVPYPRLGRTSNKDNQYFILPYPRAGRSDSKTSLLPTLRFGRSSYNILPYPRLGRSQSSILPYPRLGRSTNKDSQSKPTFILPYPRLGRKSSSGSIIPQLRVGKSHDSQLDLLMDEFEMINDDMTIRGQLNGDSAVHLEKENEGESTKDEDIFYNTPSESSNSKIKSALLVPAKKLHRHMLTSDTKYMLPYPRPGRLV